MASPLIKIKEEIGKSKLDAILISSVSNITYLTGYSGFSKEEREAYLLITKNHQYILTDGRYTTAVKTLIPDFNLIEISSKNPTKKILKALKIKHAIKKLGIEENDLRVSEHKSLTSHYDNTYHYSGTHSLREIKGKDEIFKIENACKLGDRTFDYILNKIKLGISEKETANEIEFFIKRNGAEISFDPIVAFGKNSALPHHLPTSNKLGNKQIVLLDFGVKLDNYCSDMTRTVFFGKATAEFKKIYNTVLEAQNLAIKLLNTKYLIHDTSKKTIKAFEIDKAARDYIISQGYDSIPHSLGHGIGLEVHESPNLSPKSKDILKDGMVFSIEPGIYIPNFGGVRIEDLAVIEKGNLRLLTKSPKHLVII